MAGRQHSNFDVMQACAARNSAVRLNARSTKKFKRPQNRVASARWVARSYGAQCGRGIIPCRSLYNSEGLAVDKNAAIGEKDSPVRTAVREVIRSLQKYRIGFGSWCCRISDCRGCPSTIFAVRRFSGSLSSIGISSPAAQRRALGDEIAGTAQHKCPGQFDCRRRGVRCQ